MKIFLLQRVYIFYKLLCYWPTVFGLAALFRFCEHFTEGEIYCLFGSATSGEASKPEAWDKCVRAVKSLIKFIASFSAILYSFSYSKHQISRLWDRNKYHTKPWWIEYQFTNSLSASNHRSSPNCLYAIRCIFRMVTLLHISRVYPLHWWAHHHLQLKTVLYVMIGSVLNRTRSFRVTTCFMLRWVWSLFSEKR